jgi:hypothetical protein
MTPNALDPNLMTPAERLREVGEILADGLLRRPARAEVGSLATAERAAAPGASHGRKRLLRRRAAP